MYTKRIVYAGVGIVTRPPEAVRETCSELDVRIKGRAWRGDRNTTYPHTSPGLVAFFVFYSYLTLWKANLSIIVRPGNTTRYGRLHSHVHDQHSPPRPRIQGLLGQRAAGSPDALASGQHTSGPTAPGRRRGHGQAGHAEVRAGEHFAKFRDSGSD